MSQYAVKFDDVLQAAKRISTRAHRTPVMTCQSLDQWIGTKVYLKCENLQVAGAFKFRGALNAITQLTDPQKTAGVVTHSSGNHAGALAAAAGMFGIAAHIVMPNNSTQVKMDAVRSYGGEITQCEPTLADRERVASEVQARTGATLIPPFNHPHVIAGQGTCALELWEQVPYLDVVVSPVGGGGLMSGTCVVSRHVKPLAKILGVEPEGAKDAFESKQAGEWIPQTDPQTICDGLRTSLGELTWPYIRDQVDEILLANDAETTEAMRFCWERTKMIIEPSCAVVLAALKKKIERTPKSEIPRHVGVIIGGGNVDLGNLPWN